MVTQRTKPDTLSAALETTLREQNVSLHINNVFRKGELEMFSVVKESLTTAADGKKYKTKFYNLDVIISVGYRVKSPIGEARWRFLKQET